LWAQSWGGGVVLASLHCGIEFGWSRTGEGPSMGRKKGVVRGVGQELLGPSYFSIKKLLHLWGPV
jgi:hypothetical protein